VFDRQAPEAEFEGSDADSDAIAWSSTHLPAGFVVNDEWPPAPLDNDSFDVLIAISVLPIWTRLIKQPGLAR
jgi:hypothetical protein